MGQTGRGRPPASVEVRGKLQLWRVDDGRRGSARSARADPADARRTGLSQAALRLAMSRAKSGGLTGAKDDRFQPSPAREGMKKMIVGERGRNGREKCPKLWVFFFSFFFYLIIKKNQYLLETSIFLVKNIKLLVKYDFVFTNSCRAFRYIKYIIYDIYR